MNINWSRGLFRLWLILAVFWIIVVGTLSRPDQAFLQFIQANSSISSEQSLIESDSELSKEQQIAMVSAVKRAILEKRRRAKQDLAQFATISILPIFIVFVAGAALLWAVQGFSGPIKNRRDKN